MGSGKDLRSKVCMQALPVGVNAVGFGGSSSVKLKGKTTSTPHRIIGITRKDEYPTDGLRLGLCQPFLIYLLREKSSMALYIKLEEYSPCI